MEYAWRKCPFGALTIEGMESVVGDACRMGGFNGNLSPEKAIRFEQKGKLCRLIMKNLLSGAERGEIHPALWS